jgi:four helix bundle protein
MGRGIPVPRALSRQRTVLSMQDFRKLVVWAKAHQLTLHVYRVSVKLARKQDAGLASQLRRAAASIPANIAEGCHRGTGGDMARFLDIAFASAGEVDYHLLLARDLSILPEREYQNLSRKVEEVKRMLAGLQKKVRASL